MRVHWIPLAAGDRLAMREAQEDACALAQGKRVIALLTSGFCLENALWAPRRQWSSRWKASTKDRGWTWFLRLFSCS